MKVALVHDWLTGMRGGERVLEHLCELFPDATLFTLFHKPGSVSPKIESMPIHASFLNRLPQAVKYYPYLLPFYPMAVSKFDLSGFDLILSISHAAAKGIRKPRNSVHVCYCLTPMRYIWDMRKDYFQYSDPIRLKRNALQAITLPFRAWDRSTARRVDHFIAISQYVQNRISKYYGRDSDVIYPPVDTEFFTPSSNAGHSDFYLMVSALVSYKRVDVAIEAFNQLPTPLIIVGGGPDLARLKAKAAPNVQLRGFVSDEDLRDLYQRCRGVVITACEDFGLVSLEAQACGRPAVAFAAGGSVESIVDGETGILFGPRTADGLIEAIKRLESTQFNPDRLRQNAERFSCRMFRQALTKCVQKNFQPCSSSRSPKKLGRQVRAVQRSAGEHPSVASIAKRAVDIVLSGCAFLLLGLPLLAIALLIRLQSSGPAFFFQTRVGYRGRKFTIAKLRTMRANAESDGCAVWAVENDSRCTPLGGFLRRYGIDELPQLWNVLKGEMSLVGPRPERPMFHQLFAAEFPDFARRLEVRGGITGLAQIRGWRGNTDIQGRIKSDLEYIEQWSFGKDLLILCRTPLSIVRMPKQQPGLSPVAVVDNHRLTVP